MKKIPTPLCERVLIKKEEVEEYSEGGIALPEQTKEANKAALTKGTIIAKGSMAWFDKPGSECEVGDEIMIRRYGGVSITVDGIEYHMVNDEDIIARL